MIKKYIALVCIAAFMIMPFGADVIASDAAEDYSQEIALLESIGAIKGYKDGNFAPDAEMTRAELAMLSVCALGLDANIAADNTNYHDVPMGYWASGYINLAEKLGIMVGYDGLFDPDGTVNAIQASKVMVQMLGYEQHALEKGGYPTGYLMMAKQLDILSGVDTNGVFTRGKAARMLYNTLHAEPLELKYLYSDSAVYSSGNRRLMEITLGIIKEEGRVDSNYIASLWGNPDCREGELTIDGSRYKISDSSYNDYLGRSVEYYFKDSDALVKELVYMNLEYDDGVTYEIAGKNILNNDSSFSTRNFVFSDENGKIKKLDIEDAIVFINGKVPMESVTKSDLAPVDGKVVLIDDDNNGNIDIVYISEWKTVLTATVNMETEEILDKLGNGTIDCSSANHTVKVIKDGVDVLLSAIKEWDVLLVSESRDGKYIQINATAQTVSGRLSKYENDEIIVVNETEYELNPYMDRENLMLGENMVLRMDSEGRVAHVEFDKFSKGGYGYMFGAAKQSEMSNRIKIKVLTQNSEIKILESADKIRFNDEGSLGAKDVYDRIYASGTMNGMLIVYSVNTDGLVNQIYTPEEDSQYLSLDYPESKRSYSKSANIFGLYEAKGFSIDDTAPIFYIVDGAEEDCRLITTSTLIDKTAYTVEGYNAGETMTPKAIVVKVAPGGANMSVTFETPLGVIDRITMGLNAKDEEVPIIHMIASGQEIAIPTVPQEKLKMLKIHYPNRLITDTIEFSDLQRGDLIYYSTDYNGEIDQICKVLPFEKDGVEEGDAIERIATEYEWIAEHGWSNEKVFGTLENMNGNLIEVSVENTENPSDASRGTYLFSIGGASVTVVNVGDDEIYVGGTDELIPAKLDPNRCSKIYMKVGAGIVYDIVIYNNWR